jgi:YcxB-like protein
LSPTTKRDRPLTFGLLAVPLSFFLGAPDEPLRERLILSVLADCGFLFVVGLLCAVIIPLSFISSKNRTFLTEHTFTLTEDGFIEETVFNRTENRWAAALKVVRTRNYIFLFVSQNAAHAIPRWAFVSDEEWDEFFAYCQQHVGE